MGEGAHSEHARARVLPPCLSAARWSLRFIGVLEVVGGLGLVLPGLLHLRPVLTPLAALGLVIIMSGALGVSLTTGHADTAAIPVFVGILLAIVAVVRGLALQPPRV